MNPPHLNKSNKSPLLEAGEQPKKRPHFFLKGPCLQVLLSRWYSWPKKRPHFFLKGLLLAVLVIAATFYIKRDDWGISALIRHTTNGSSSAVEHVPDPVRYDALKAELKNERAKLKKRYLRASTTAQQDQILTESSQLLGHYLPQLMRCWLGHPWDFNGTATVPGEGKIACGYYVSTIMRDAGFKVKRIKLAQQPSQRIIKTFVPRDKMWITVGKNYDSYTNTLQSNYEGINIVGLDKHVAFVVVKDGEMRFIHSGGLEHCVVDENKADAYSLKVSNYRVIANISHNRDTLLKWLLEQSFPTAK